MSHSDHPEQLPSNPAKIEWGTDQETLNALRYLIHYPLRSAITSSLRVHLTGDGMQIRTEKVAFVVPGGVVTISFPDWADTEYFAMNAFRMEARFMTAVPEWVRGEYIPETGALSGFWTGLSFEAASFSERSSPSPIKRITIYRRARERQHIERNFTERVAFDNAILFDREPGSPPLLLFVDESSIAGMMGISINAEEIARVLEGCTISTVMDEIQE